MEKNIDNDKFYLTSTKESFFVKTKVKKGIEEKEIKIIEPSDSEFEILFEWLIKNINSKIIEEKLSVQVVITQDRTDELHYELLENFKDLLVYEIEEITNKLHEINKK